MNRIEKLESQQCRTCYNSTKGLKLLTRLTKYGASQLQKSYAEILKEVSNVNIMEDSYEELPQLICEGCARRLKAAYIFIQQVHEVNERLTSIAVRLEANQHLNCLQEPPVDILSNFKIKEEHDDLEVVGEFESQCLVVLKVEESEQSIETSSPTVDVLSIKKDEEITDLATCKESRTTRATNTNGDCNYTLKGDLLKKNDITRPDSQFSNYNDDDIRSNDSDLGDEKEISPNRNNAKKISSKFKKSEKSKKKAYDDVAVLCSECNKIFRNSQSLARHKRNTHISEDQKCTCPLCNRRFSRSCNMYTHMRSFHGPDSVTLKRKPSTKERLFQCDKCERNYIKRSHLNMHIKEKHGNDDDYEKEKQKSAPKESSGEENPPTKGVPESNKPKRYEVRSLCSVCGSSFASRTHLIVHMRRHTGERPFKCDLCERAYPRLSELVCHRRIHTGEKPFKCKICDKAFRVSSKMSTHMRSHTDIRPYKCKQCERSFKYSKDLNIHFRIHTGERPYSCNVCGSTFTQSNTLKAHRSKLGHKEDVIEISNNII